MNIDIHRLSCCLISVIMQIVLFGFNGLAAQTQKELTMKIESSSFTHNGYIPLKYTGEGDDISPPLRWTDIPPGTQSLALICDDPDAPMGTWDHWILYQIPPDLDHIDEGGKNLPPEVLFGKNTWGRQDYGGPQPPSGTHHYHFTLYALDRKLDLKSGVTKDELKKAMDGHVLATATLTGLYKLTKSK